MPPKKPSLTATRDSFLQEVEDFLAESDMYPSHFGFEALNDSRFVSRLREPDSDVKASTIDRCRLFIHNWRKAHA